MMQDNEKILRTFFETAPVMMGVVDVSNDDIIHISDNPASARFFGLDSESMKGKKASELGICHETINVWINHYKKAQKSKKPVHFTYWHNTGNEKRHFSATVNLIESSEGSLPRFSYFVEDSTETKIALEQLKDQETFLETVLDNIPDMIFVKDAQELRFVKFNKAGEDLIGLGKEELLGKNDYDLFPKSQADHFTANDRLVIQNEKILDIPQEPIETKFKGKRILHTKKIPLFDAYKNPIYLIGISEDITEKLQTQEMKQKIYHEQVARLETEKSLKARDEFISIASHELKSPLSSLKLQAQMFRRNISRGKEEVYSPEKINQMMELTEQQVLRLDRLVNDMLDVSRIRTGQLTMQMSEFNLYELVKDVLGKMNEQIKSSAGSPPVFAYSSENIIGIWDQMRIEQVLVNLLTNALRYGEGRPIEVKLDEVENVAQFSVHDQGIGIPGELLDKIFDRFERAIHPSEVSGLGLGLFISKQIVQAHGGKIWVESEEKKGSSFFVQLPLNCHPA